MLTLDFVNKIDIFGRMGMKCDIHVEKPPEGAFRPGNTVAGYVQYFLTKETQFESIRLGLKGRGDCSWKEKSRSDSGNRSRFEAKEQVIEADNNILTSPTGFVPAGMHTAAFRFKLPENVPPTFKYYGDGCSASVSYCIRVKFIFAGFFSFPATYRADVIVTNTVKPTLPLEPITYGLQDSLHRKFGFVGAKIDADLKVTISKSFLGPGENADLCLQVTNNTNYSIPKLRISLFEVLTLSDDVGRSKIILKEIKESRAKTEKVKKCNYTCMYSSISLPSDLTTLQGSRLICRDYKVVITMSIPDIKRETTLDIPIQIGQLTAPIDTVNFEATCPENVVNLMPENVYGSTNNLVVNNNSMVVNQNHVTVNAGPSSTNESPPPYWEVMEDEKKC